MAAGSLSGCPLTLLVDEGVDPVLHGSTGVAVSGDGHRGGGGGINVLRAGRGEAEVGRGVRVRGHCCRGVGGGRSALGVRCCDGHGVGHSRLNSCGEGVFGGGSQHGFGSHYTIGVLQGHHVAGDCGAVVSGSRPGGFHAGGIRCRCRRSRGGCRSCGGVQRQGRGLVQATVGECQAVCCHGSHGVGLARFQRACRNAEGRAEGTVHNLSFLHLLLSGQRADEVHYVFRQSSGSPLAGVVDEDVDAVIGCTTGVAASGHGQVLSNSRVEVVSRGGGQNQGVGVRVRGHCIGGIRGRAVAHGAGGDDGRRVAHAGLEAGEGV